MRAQHRGGDKRSLILALVAAYAAGMLIMLTQLIVSAWPVATHSL